MERAKGLRGGPKASQIRGVLDLPSVDLHPAVMTHGAEWHCDPNVLVTLGIMCHMDAILSYRPIRIHRRVRKAMINFQVDVFDHETEFDLRFRYLDRDEKAFEIVSERMGAETPDTASFEIPQGHICTDGWLTASLGVKLLTPMQGAERERAIRDGREAPFRPILIRGAWAELRS